MNIRISLALPLLLAGCGAAETGKRAAEFNARQERAQKVRLQEAAVRLEKKRPDVSAAYGEAPREIGGRLAILPATGEAPDYGDVDRSSTAKRVMRKERASSQAQLIAEAEKRRKETLAAQDKSQRIADDRRLSDLKGSDATAAKRYRPGKPQLTPLGKAPTGGPKGDPGTSTKNAAKPTPSTGSTPRR